jgi:hypothetical protein
MDTRDLTPGDRRELRSLVKKQFDVLRKDVKRREAELRSEIESELLHRYRGQDEALSEARQQMDRARNDYILAVQKIGQDLLSMCPELEVQTVDQYGRVGLSAQDNNRAERHRALLASIPQQVASAQTRLDQEELDLLRDLTVGALDSEQAREFLDRIPTVGQLVPKARLAELEGEPS